MIYFTYCLYRWISAPTGHQPNPKGRPDPWESEVRASSSGCNAFALKIAALIDLTRCGTSGFGRISMEGHVGIWRKRPVKNLWKLTEPSETRRFFVVEHFLFSWLVSFSSDFKHLAPHTHTHTWWPSNLLSYHIRQKKKQNLLVPFPREWLFYVVLMVGEDHENFPRTFPKRHLLIGWVPTASPTGRCPVLRICCRKSSCPLFWPKDDDASRCREQGRCEDQWRW